MPIFGTLIITGTIDVIIYGKYYLQYEDGVLIQAFVDDSMGLIPLLVRGSGKIGCRDSESRSAPIITYPEVKFCIYDDLGIMNDVENVLYYLSDRDHFSRNQLAQ
ncbi:MAG: hypothetical protein MRQ11_04005 [Candidatus Midichloria mitochondrii]|uniref:hypothetical protein n=1 Tax=Candidatus Midichloria mitochondrii TaxID=234827 RepID=UPI0002F3AC8A|nr:hypothetical protein [Candidatus Midichloria mitochondrii]MDJ1256919.1 hypothetical protein [Candidatus Midichloria mitochondrii]MDJ1299488.1 hypothetical protein [Candidatus Midichloria mitochondrii]MDJ1583838.1 hypothetical protein [Candidatus Midichloria mitochondrii]